jgi:ABC-2 type transport system ATP-binding protein
MSTPYLDEAERCGRVLLLHEGRVLAIDRPAELQQKLKGSLFEVITGTSRPPLEALGRVPGVRDAQVFGDRAHVLYDGAPEQAVSAIRDALVGEGIAVGSVRPIGATLEDVFIGMLHAE